ncbi:hypothetical protein Tco_0058812, partial [Tanacetum coccineum]
SSSKGDKGGLQRKNLLHLCSRLNRGDSSCIIVYKRASITATNKDWHAKNAYEYDDEDDFSLPEISLLCLSGINNIDHQTLKRRSTCSFTPGYHEFQTIELDCAEAVEYASILQDEVEYGDLYCARRCLIKLMLFLKGLLEHTSAAQQQVQSTRSPFAIDLRVLTDNVQKNVDDIKGRAITSIQARKEKRARDQAWIDAGRVLGYVAAVQELQQLRECLSASHYSCQIDSCIRSKRFDVLFAMQGHPL